LDLFNDSSGVRELRNSNCGPSENPDSSLPAHHILRLNFRNNGFRYAV
jgi:hypothetical protein